MVAEDGHDSIHELNNEQIQRELEYCILEFSEGEVAATGHADAVRPHAAYHVEAERDYKGYHEALGRGQIGQHRGEDADRDEAYMFEVERFHKL